MSYDVNVDVPNELVRLGIITHNPLTDKGATPRFQDYPLDDYNGKNTSTTKKVLKYGAVATLLAAAIYGGYKLISKGKGGQPPISFATLKAKVAENLGKAKNWVMGLFKKDPAKAGEETKGIFSKAKDWIVGLFKKAPEAPKTP